MAGILNKLMDFIGIEDVDDEGYNEDYFNDCLLYTSDAADEL